MCSRARIYHCFHRPIDYLDSGGRRRILITSIDTHSCFSPRTTLVSRQGFVLFEGEGRVIIAFWDGSALTNDSDSMGLMDVKIRREISGYSEPNCFGLDCLLIATATGFIRSL